MTTDAPVRLDRRVSWFALLVLAAVTLAAVPATRYGVGVTAYWPPALLLAYAVIALRAVRRARVLPHVLSALALAAVHAAVWLLVRRYVAGHPPAAWVFTVDRLAAPTGAIGLALLVLARLERHAELLAFALVYLALVLQPIGPAPAPTPMPATQQLVTGALLLLGAAGFALAGRWRRRRFSRPTSAARPPA